MEEKTVNTFVKCPACEKTFVTQKTDGSLLLVCKLCGTQKMFSQFTEIKTKKICCPKCKTPLKVAENFKGRLTCLTCKFNGNILEFPERKSGLDDHTDVPVQQLSGDVISRPAVLVFTKSDATCAPKTLLLKKGVNTIGRKADCTIQLDTTDEYISRHHARVELRARTDGAYEYLLTDWESRNGTFLNEERLEKEETVFISLGDRIRFGHTTFTFTLE